MDRKELNDMTLENISGGSICFSLDHTTCGLNCNNQCKVNDYEACQLFIAANMYNMSEKTMLKEMIAKGYLTLL